MGPRPDHHEWLAVGPEWALRNGFAMVTLGSDASLLERAAAGTLREFRRSATARGGQASR